MFTWKWGEQESTPSSAKAKRFKTALNAPHFAGPRVLDSYLLSIDLTLWAVRMRQKGSFIIFFSLRFTRDFLLVSQTQDQRGNSIYIVINISRSRRLRCDTLPALVTESDTALANFLLNFNDEFINNGSWILDRCVKKRGDISPRSHQTLERPNIHFELVALAAKKLKDCHYCIVS